MDGIIADPVGMSCRSELATSGSLLFEAVGTSEPMQEVLRRVAGMDPAHAMRRRAVLTEALATSDLKAMPVRNEWFTG